MVKCDAIKQVVTLGEGKTILSEKFVQCPKERRSIVQTSSFGRVGLCPDHLEHYQGLDDAGKRTYFRMRHGKIMAGERVEEALPDKG